MGSKFSYLLQSDHLQATRLHSRNVRRTNWDIFLNPKFYLQRYDGLDFILYPRAGWLLSGVRAKATRLLREQQLQSLRMLF